MLGATGRKRMMTQVPFLSLPLGREAVANSASGRATGAHPHTDCDKQGLAPPAPSIGEGEFGLGLPNTPGARKRAL